MSDLDPARIHAELHLLGANLGRPLVVVDETASTNDDARKAASNGAPHGAVFLAETQTRGRGRSGRAWHSPSGENLYMSIVLRPDVPPMALPPLALVIGVCVARVVDDALGVDPLKMLRAGIKWPNDVYVDQHKLAGILIETSLRGARVDTVVVGVGMNVNTTTFPSDLRATSLRMLGASQLDRSLLAARLLAEVERALPHFSSERLEPFLEELNRRDMLHGLAIEVAGTEGIGAGIDEQGFLCVKSRDGVTHRFGSGSVNLVAFDV